MGTLIINIDVLIIILYHSLSLNTHFRYDNFWTFVASRFSAGIAVGVTHFLLPVYVQEIASVHLKPILLNILYVQFAFGILVQYFVGKLIMKISYILLRRNIRAFNVTG